ncbi:GNAT family N-acetyltransferase [Nocardioides mesophilus]|uniref:GNAT family N-acetyltransferase n=1 Tax=Nocardioides mesophilus TaxID=433659 RepID=A0A7G9R8B3_9ACTN|nr:GNAT family N-acetyltransferase [Nocardioides mesophilus]QNN51838.1 GNAT family N-acetyltransferase [Nocardioides mesophilus]
MPDATARGPAQPGLAPPLCPVTVRRATPDDAPDVAVMVGEIAALENQTGHVHVDEAGWRRLLGRAEVIVLLAERDGAAVGYVSAVRQLHLWTGGDVLALDDLYVRPGHRDGGAGRRLMAAMAATAAPDQLVVRWGVEPDNLDAQRFYRRLGATLRPKVTVTWSPAASADVAAE